MPGAPGAGPSVPPPKGVKIKPRYEFVIVFTWKEPTPSDKLRQIKKREAAAADSGTMGGGKFGGGMPAGPSPSAPGPADSGGGSGLRVGGSTDID
jgi:hypothetical protein